MSLIIPQRGTETVDIKFSPLFEPNLFKGKVFQPGLTATDKYDTNEAGHIVVRKLGKATVTKTGAVKFDHTQTADSQISIIFNKPYAVSEMVIEDVETARSSESGAAKLADALAAVGEEMQADAHLEYAINATALAETAESTSQTLKANIVSARKELVAKGAKATTLVVSPTIYGMMLENSGKEFIPSSNEVVMETGILGRYLGMDVIESPYLSDELASGAPDSVTEVRADEDIEFFMYDKDAFSFLTQLNIVRLVDAGKDWVGSAAQVKTYGAYTVTNADRCYKKLAVATPTVPGN